MNHKRKIIEGYQSILPVDLTSIARDLNLDVYKANFREPISGKIERAARKYAIYVNKQHSYERQRFTLAHEIAHFVLHQDFIDNEICDNVLYRSHLPTQCEMETNRLVANMLMPAEKIKQLIHNLEANDAYSPHTILDILAEKFEVSKYVMSLRLGIPYHE